MTIILPYKKDLLEGFELKYCLRAIEQHLTGWTNLILMGYPPDWFKGDCFKSQDYDGRKQFSIYNKLLLATNLTNCTEDFVMFNDDHFLTRDLNIHYIKYWFDNSLQDELKKEMGGRYRKALLTTFKTFPDGLNFDVHTPIIYNKAKFKELFKDRKGEICIKSTYCNSFHVEPVQIEDCKINNVMSYEMIKEKTEDKLFFSTGDNGLKPPLFKFLQEKYPNKSQWEK